MIEPHVWLAMLVIAGVAGGWDNLTSLTRWVRHRMAKAPNHSDNGETT